MIEPLNKDSGNVDVPVSVPVERVVPEVPDDIVSDRVVELLSPDGKSYFVSDEAEAAHLHRAHGYRFVQSSDRTRILPNH